MKSSIEKFIKYLETEKNASPHTLKNYAIDLKEFANHLNSKPIQDVTYLDIRAFLALLKDKNYSKSSVSRKLACIRSCFKFLVRENIIKTNPALNIATPKREKRLPRF